MSIIESGLPANVSERKACDVLAVCRNMLARVKREQHFCGPPKSTNRSCTHSIQPRALTPKVRQQVLDTLTSEVYCNQPRDEEYFSLMEQGDYLCSISTMHRIFRDN